MDYAERGWPVFPVHSMANGACTCGREDCDKPAKHPCWKRDLIEHGFKDASTDAAMIRRYWKRWPDANIGLATGQASGIIVVDVDPRNGGNETWAELLDINGQVKTLESVTGGGGTHAYFRAPVEQLKSVAGVLGPGVDTKATGGYVILPPSVHASGHRYEWVAQELAPATVPDWLQARWPKVRVSSNDHRPSEVLGKPVVEGQRNRRLASLAGSMRRHGASKNAIEVALVEENAGYVPPLPASEALRVAASISNYVPAPPGGFHRTDMGNARRLVAQYGDRLRYCWPWGCWLVWDGRRWARDATGGVLALAKEAVQSIYGEAAAEQDDGQRQALRKWGAVSESERRIASMVSLAKSEPDIPVLPAELDINPWVLNCVSGVLDLRTGLLHPHDPARMITKLAPVKYDPGARYALWDDFLEAAISDSETRQYVQKLAGYSLAGDASEDVIVLLHGRGGTGKDTFRGALAGALGPDYAASADLGTFTNRRDPHGPKPDLARLAAVRLVTISEPQAGETVALLKQATGGGPIAARSHHQETFEFTPQFTLWLMSNDRPKVPDTDTGIWRRMCKIPFTTVFNPPDPTVRQRLADPTIAGPAILAWAVEGCLAWQREGLGDQPPQVVEATAEYKEEMDPLADWLEDRTVSVADAWSFGGNLWDSYQEWATRNRIKSIGRKSFSQRLAGRFTAEKRGSNKDRGWLGVGLLGDPLEQ